MGPARPVDMVYCQKTRIKTGAGAMWRRTLFFWLDALQISAGERRIMLTLMTLIVGITGISVFGTERTVYDQDYYKPVMEEFRRLSKVEAQNEKAVMARYYPEIVSDTTDRADEQQATDEEKDDPELNETDPVNIQSAGKEELMSLPGIGPVTAERILDYRNEHGRFEHPEELLNVSGIGPVTLDNIREYLVVE